MWPKSKFLILLHISFLVKEKLIENQKAKNQEVPDEAFLDMLMRCQVIGF